ncbi:uncharacterized protein LOC144703429 [Wolffia australiana]
MAEEFLHSEESSETSLQDVSPTAWKRTSASKAPVRIAAALVPSIKLTMENYVIWKAQVQPTLKSNRLMTHITEEPPMEASDPESEWWYYDQHALAFLLLSMTESVISCVTEAQTAKAAWDILVEDFASSAEARVQELLGKLHTQTKGNMTLEEYISHFRSLSSALTPSGEHADQRTLVRALLRGFGPQYAPVITTVRAAVPPMALETSSQPWQIKLSQRQQTATLEKGKHENQSRESGAMDAGQEEQDNNKQDGLHQDARYAREPDIGRSSSQFDLPSRPSPHAYGTTSSTVNSSHWYPDCGATHHVATDPNLLVDPQVYSGQDKLYIGDSTVRQFIADNNVVFEFHPTHCVVKDCKRSAPATPGIIVLVTLPFAFSN